MQNSIIKYRLNAVLTQMFWGLKQWLYRGKRPNWIAKTLNRGIANSVSKTISPDGVVALEVIGRKSGRIVSFPLVMVIVDGQRYLASMLGNSAQWVRNVRAAGGKATLRSGGQ
ncbi:MAG TPA: nitroreductase/quinone reductase family protein, partial [Anaerolineales bacterium]|nr:nitroreductase/quinone reductase family protein [Anaerolineales bacterium]